MKIITANLLNRFWKNGVKPIKEKADNALQLSGGTMTGELAVPDILLSDSTYEANITPNRLFLDSTGEAIITLKNDSFTSTSSIKLESVTDYIELRNSAVENRADFINTNKTELNLKLMASTSSAMYYKFSGSSFYPSSSSVNLGTSGYKWSNIYATNGTIQTSDQTKKCEIESLEEETSKAFVMGLNPVSYKMTNGTSGRTHYGLIAQDIEDLMAELNMDSKDFAGFIKSPKVTTKDIDEDGNPLKSPIEEFAEGEYDYALRYDEFIAPLIKVVQCQQREIEKLKRVINSI